MAQKKTLVTGSVAYLCDKLIYRYRGPIEAHCGPHARGTVPSRCPRLAVRMGAPAGHGSMERVPTVGFYGPRYLYRVGQKK